MKLKIKKLHPSAKIPTYGSSHAAGLDLYTAIDEPIMVRTLDRACIPTGISVQWDSDKWYLRVAARSGLSVRNQIDIGAGVIDYDYRGQINVVVINASPIDHFTVTPGMKIAQLIPTRYDKAEIIEVDELDTTQRGDNGFGSTGI